MTGASPDDFHHLAAGPHEPLRTFHPRRAALGRDRADALDRLWPRYGFSVHDDALGRGPRTPDGLLDTDALFGRHAPLVLEIGPGMGEATVETAADDPGRDYLAVEAHLPGVANLLTIYSALSGIDVPALEEKYAGAGYGDLKKDLADVVVGFLAPFQERVRHFLSDPGALDDVLVDGAHRARDIAAGTLDRVYERTGLLPRGRG